MKMHGVIQEFETVDEALEFAYKYSEELNLSYVPVETRKDIIHDAMGSVHMGILLKDPAWASSDIGNEINKEVGQNLLRYMEWKAKNPGEEL